MRMGVEEMSFADQDRLNVAIQSTAAGQGNGGGESDSYPSPTTSRLASLLGSQNRDYLLSTDGAQVKVSELQGKVVGLYFSANWYPPCRNFNQFLIGAYQQLKTTNGSNFEIVFVSCDEDSDAFNSYRAGMPWLSLPFSDLEAKKSLTSKFEIEGIPCLVVLQPASDGKYVDSGIRNGVELMYRFGVNAFPFTEQRLEELQRQEKEKHDSQTLINLLTNHDRDYVLAHPPPKQVSVASLVGKTIGLYFSAQWCLPCEKFTPKLIPIYQKIKQTLAANSNNNNNNEHDFEVVFVSNDRDQDGFESYFAQMPWLALPFGDPNIKTLAKHFDVQGIPCLVILGPDGKTITTNGRSLINLYQDSAFPFTESKVESLEREMDEEAKSLPKTKQHEGHRHELTLVSQETGGGPFICCNCEEQGLGWAYQCLDCGYELHPKCVRPTGTVATIS
ncbi:Probable nucleoredoxin 2 [Linum grandiflorum]